MSVHFYQNYFFLIFILCKNTHFSKYHQVIKFFLVILIRFLGLWCRHATPSVRHWSQVKRIFILFTKTKMCITYISILLLRYMFYIAIGIHTVVNICWVNVFKQTYSIYTAITHTCTMLSFYGICVLCT